MATIEEFENQKSIAYDYRKAVEKLGKWEEGRYKGEKLNELEEKLSNEKLVLFCMLIFSFPLLNIICYIFLNVVR